MPIVRSVWAPVGERPVALGHHRFKWLSVTAFVGPATGETVWYLSNGASEPVFEKLLHAFAQEAGAGPAKRVVLLLDHAPSSSPGNRIIGTFVKDFRACGSD